MIYLYAQLIGKYISKLIFHYRRISFFFAIFEKNKYYPNVLSLERLFIYIYTFIQFYYTYIIPMVSERESRKTCNIKMLLEVLADIFFGFSLMSSTK